MKKLVTLLGIAIAASACQLSSQPGLPTPTPVAPVRPHSVREPDRPRSAAPRSWPDRPSPHPSSQPTCTAGTTGTGMLPAASSTSRRPTADGLSRR